MESGSGANALEAWAAAEARRGRSREPRARAKAKSRGRDGWWWLGDGWLMLIMVVLPTSKMVMILLEFLTVQSGDFCFGFWRSKMCLLFFYFDYHKWWCDGVFTSKNLRFKQPKAGLKQSNIWSLPEKKDIPSPKLDFNQRELGIEHGWRMSKGRFYQNKIGFWAQTK